MKIFFAALMLVLAAGFLVAPAMAQQATSVSVAVGPQDTIEYRINGKARLICEPGELLLVHADHDHTAECIIGDREEFPGATVFYIDDDALIVPDGFGVPLHQPVQLATEACAENFFCVAYPVVQNFGNPKVLDEKPPG